jgi:hypothetical protein
MILMMVDDVGEADLAALFIPSASIVTAVI